MLVVSQLRKETDGSYSATFLSSFVRQKIFRSTVCDNVAGTALLERHLTICVVLTVALYILCEQQRVFLSLFQASLCGVNEIFSLLGVTWCMLVVICRL